MNSQTPVFLIKSKNTKKVSNFFKHPSINYAA
ncbi:MAG: Unknown protein [uncultured Campylobacterales bacterium]|uniref:Uncharacterized protein n=1 Tax=uncultured Campylobacterales bacterium TaxID=352960 RepID=A0A6S6SN88_9BACT|nr:MAG: Unknown protein [uncultured Campylobacterales bacterium]